jgi:heterodisulfide reductase subunit B
MKYAYYPGCSAESTARDMHHSTLAVAAALGIEMIEPKGWTCCGATAGHQTDRTLAAALPAANLVKIRDMGLDCIVNCAACYNRMKAANYEISTEPEIRKSVSEAIGQDYDGSVKVRHFIEVLLEDVGLEKIKKAVKNQIKDLKVACYYGCLLVRPPKVVNFDDPENPTTLDKLVKAMGGETLDWPYKVECCGGGLSLSRTDVVVNLTDSILAMAKESGADCIAVSCPMCQVNLDLRQLDIKKQIKKDYQMPVVYITQLLGLALGIDSGKLGFNKLMIPATNVLEIARHSVAKAER